MAGPRKKISKKATTKKKASKKKASRRAAPPPPEPEEYEDDEYEEEETAMVVHGGGTFDTSSVPAHLQGARGNAGLEEAEADDFIMPRVALLQPTPPPGIDYDEVDIKPGDMVDSITHELLAEREAPLSVILVLMTKNRIMWESKEPGSDMLCRSFDGKVSPDAQGQTMEGEETGDCSACIFQNFDRETDEPPRCSLFYNFFALLPEFGLRPIALSMKSTNIKTAKRVLSTARASGMDLFALKWEFFALKEKNDKGTFFKFDFRPAGFVTEEEYAAASQAYEAFSTKQVKVDLGQEEVENELDDDIAF